MAACRISRRSANCGDGSAVSSSEAALRANVCYRAFKTKCSASSESASTAGSRWRLMKTKSCCSRIVSRAEINVSFFTLAYNAYNAAKKRANAHCRANRQCSLSWAKRLLRPGSASFIARKVENGDIINVSRRQLDSNLGVPLRAQAKSMKYITAANEAAWRRGRKKAWLCYMSLLLNHRETNAAAMKPGDKLIVRKCARLGGRAGGVGYARGNGAVVNQ